MEEDLTALQLLSDTTERRTVKRRLSAEMVPIRKAINDLKKILPPEMPESFGEGKTRTG